MSKGQAFLNSADQTSRGKIRHLHVIISNPDSEKDVLIVPVCTLKEIKGKPLPGQDLSCLLSAGCHPFIKNKSYISYQNAKSMNLIDIVNGLFKGILVSQQDFKTCYVQDMQKGAEESPFLPEKFKRFFNHFL